MKILKNIFEKGLGELLYMSKHLHCALLDGYKSEVTRKPVR